MEDDYDSELRYGGNLAYPSLQGMDSGNNVIYIGTFSKSLFPGLRLGYMVVPDDLVKAFSGMRFLIDRQSNEILQLSVAEFIKTGLYETHLLKMRRIFEARRDYLIEAVSDNFGERIDQKIFHAEIVVDHARVSAEEKAYKKIPIINEFKDRDGNDIMMQQIQRNYDQIKADAQAIINEEMDRIKNDPELCKRLGLDDEKTSKKE